MVLNHQVLELQVVVSHQVGAENQTKVLCKSSKVFLQDITYMLPSISRWQAGSHVRFLL